MPTGKSTNAIYRPDLGSAVMEYYEMPMQGFIGLELMPIFRVAEKSGSYPVIPQEALLKLHDVNRAPRGGYARGDWEYERGTYSTEEFGWEEPLDDTERALLDQEAPGVAEMVSTKRAFDFIMRAQEKRIADIFNSSSNFSTNDVASYWTAHSTADPVADVSDGIVAFKGQCGMDPDVLAISWKRAQDVLKCDAVVDRLKYTFPGIDLMNITAQQMAQLFGIPRVLIANGMYDSKGEGVSASVGSIWSEKEAYLCKVNASRDLLVPCVGRTFLWTADSSENPVVEQYREEQTRADIYRVRHHVDEALIKSVNKSGTAVSNVSALVCYKISKLAA